MSFLPKVECGKFKLKKAFQSGKILACIKKSEICATSTPKLIKMMLKCQVAKASSTCILYLISLRDLIVYLAHFCFVPRPKWGGMAQWLPLNTPLDVHFLMITAY